MVDILVLEVALRHLVSCQILAIDSIFDDFLLRKCLRAIGMGGRATFLAIEYLRIKK